MNCLPKAAAGGGAGSGDTRMASARRKQKRGECIIAIRTRSTSHTPALACVINNYCACATAALQYLSSRNSTGFCFEGFYSAQKRNKERRWLGRQENKTCLKTSKERQHSLATRCYSVGVCRNHGWQGNALPPSPPLQLLHPRMSVA